MIIVFGAGRLTKEPESTDKYCRFSVACDYYMGEKKVTFLNCIAFGKRAESLSKYLYKGGAVSFHGILEIKEHEGKYYTTCIINDITLPPKREEESYQQSQGYPAQSDDGDDDIPF